MALDRSPSKGPTSTSFDMSLLCTHTSPTWESHIFVISRVFRCDKEGLFATQTAPPKMTMLTRGPISVFKSKSCLVVFTKVP